jgi:hypothetical protein
MAKKKAAVKKVGAQRGLKKVAPKKVTRSKKKVVAKRTRLSDKKFPNDANVWVDILSYVTRETTSQNEIEMYVKVAAKGLKAKYFTDFDYRAEYKDINDVQWRFKSVDAVEPLNAKDGTLKFTLVKDKSTGGSIVVGEEELVVTVLTTKSTKPSPAT